MNALTPQAPASGSTPNDRQCMEVRRADLPLACPLPGMSLWNSHPRVYLPIAETGKAKCPYCGTEFVLID
jgi:uncharacterized Zn-finger protein